MNVQIVITYVGVYSALATYHRWCHMTRGALPKLTWETSYLDIALVFVSFLEITMTRTMGQSSLASNAYCGLGAAGREGK